MIKDRVKQIREHLKMNQQEFSDFLNVSQTSISSLEKGKSKPGFEFIESLLEKLPNINPQWLIQGIGNMFINEGEGITILKKPDNEKIDNNSLVEFLKEELRQKNKIIDKLMNSDKTSQTAGFTV